MIEEVGPNLVDAGLVNIGVFLGIVAGVVIVYLIQWAMKTGNKTGFKRYYQELDDGSKKEIDANIHNIELNLQQLATKTNTKYFKTLHNQFSSFLSYMKQKWMQS